ncbi:MAG: hypothetical protein ACE5EO_06175 [Candidatus Krumholzibacteriia bacterium]
MARRRLAWLSLCAPVAALCLAAAVVNAYDRRYLPLNAAVGVADVIVVAAVEAAPDGSVRHDRESAAIRVLEILKGDVTSDRLTVSLHPGHWRALGRWNAGDRHIVFLREPRPAAGRMMEVMLDGTCPYEASTARSVRFAADELPSWSGSQRGVATLLVPEKFRVDPGEDIDLWIGYKNVTSRDVVLSYRNWPLESHTYWELWVESDAAGTVSPVSHPHVSPAEVTEYFSTNPHLFELTLEPGQTYFFPLLRVNSAEHGWGYKERLDFKYYPMKAPGRYSITALGHHVRRDTMTRAEPLQVWIK